MIARNNRYKQTLACVKMRTTATIYILLIIMSGIALLISNSGVIGDAGSVNSTWHMNNYAASSSNVNTYALKISAPTGTSLNIATMAPSVSNSTALKTPSIAPPNSTSITTTTIAYPDEIAVAAGRTVQITRIESNITTQMSQMLSRRNGKAQSAAGTTTSSPYVIKSCNTIRCEENVTVGYATASSGIQFRNLDLSFSNSASSTNVHVKGVYAGISNPIMVGNNGSTLYSLYMTPRSSFPEMNLSISFTKSGPKGVPTLSSSYSYFTINSSVSDSYISEADYFFRVNQSWINSMKIQPSQVRLYKYINDSWNPLPTSMLNYSNGYYEYGAVSNSFSIYAISFNTGNAVGETSSVSLTLPSGYSLYLCEAGANYTFAKTGQPFSWTSDVSAPAGASLKNSANASIGHQTSNVCTASVSGVAYPGLVVGGLGTNAANYTLFSTSSSSTARPSALSYTVNTQGSFTVIMVASGYYNIKSVAIPTGCVKQQFVNNSNPSDIYEGIYIATCAGQAKGSYSVTAALSGSGSTAMAAYVFPSPSISITPSATTLDSGQTETYTMRIVNGAGPFNVELFNITGGTRQGANVTIALPGGSNTISFVTSNTGTFTYNAISTDTGASSYVFNSIPNSILVNSAMSALVLSPNSPLIDNGQGITLTGSWTGGTAPYTATWYAGPSGNTCAQDAANVLATYTGISTLSNSLIVSPTSTNGYCIGVTDSASTPVTMNSMVDAVTVNPALVANSVSPNAVSIDRGQFITLTSGAYGGTAPYSYQWYSSTGLSCGPSNSIVAGGTSTVITNSPTTSTRFCMAVTDSATINQTVTSENALVTVNPSLSAGSPTPLNPSIDTGQSITLTANISGGTPPYSYKWYSSTGSSCSSSGTAVASGNSVTVTNSPTSNTLFCYTVTDSAANSPVTLTSGNTLVKVNPSLSAGSPTPLNPSIDTGQSITLTANPSGGTTPYTYKWYSSTGSSCSSSGTAVASGNSVTVTNSPTSNTLFCYTVTDSAANSPVTLTSGNTLVTVNSSLLVGSPTPSNPSIDTGQSITLTANPSGGSPPYSYQWYSSPSGACRSSGDKVASGNSVTVTNSPTSNTLFCYSVSDTSTNPPVLTSGNSLVTVNPSLSAGSPIPLNPSIDDGQSITLTANISGGTPPYTFQWYRSTSTSCNSSSTLISSATSNSYSTSPLIAVRYCYTVTDSAANSPVTLTSGNTLVSVNPSLSAGSPTPSNPSIDSGQYITLTANPSGGTTPYTYKWYSSTGSSCSSSGTAVASGNSVTVTNSPTSNTLFCYTVSDSSANPPTLTSGNTIVKVNPVLSAGSPTPLNPSIDDGQSITLTANITGGTSPYSYKWYSSTGSSCSSSGTAVASGNSVTVTNSPIINTMFCYTVTDSAANSPVTLTSGNTLVTVNPSLSAGSPTPLNPSIDSGQYITLAAHISGGTTPYTYKWYSSTGSSCSSSGTAVASGNSVTVTNSPTSNTLFCYTVSDSSANPPTLTSGNTIVKVNPVLSAGSPTPLNPSIDTGQSITLTANISGGTPPYSYQWYYSTSHSCSSSNIMATSGNAVTITNSPTINTMFCYTVTDSAANSPVTLTSGNTLVTVNPSLSAGSPTPSNFIMDTGQSITLTANPSGGTTPYTYQWYSSTGSSCGSSNTLVTSGNSVTVTNSPTSNTLFCYTVTDSAANSPVTLTSGNTLAIVSNAPSLSISPSNITLDSGQIETYTIKETGGTGPFNIELYNVSGSKKQGSNLTIQSPGGSNTISFTVNSPASSNTFTYNATATDTGTSVHFVFISAQNSILVNPALAEPSITPNSPAYDIGQKATLAGNWSGGTAPYTVNWTISDGNTIVYNSIYIGTVASNSITFSSNALGAGSFNAILHVNDSATTTVKLASSTHVVEISNTMSNLALTPNSPSYDIGQKATLAGNWSGGTPPYTFNLTISNGSAVVYNSLFRSSTTSNNVVFAVNSLGSGSYNAILNVTDSATNAVKLTSVVDTININSGLVSPSKPLELNEKADQGQTATIFTAIPSTGTPPYSYIWLVETPTSNGNFIQSNSTICTKPSGSNTPSGNTVICSFVTNGLTAIGNYTFKLNVTDSATVPVTVSSGSNAITLNAAFTAPSTPIITNPKLDQGQTATITANMPSTGTPPYSYIWLSSFNGGVFVTAPECSNSTGSNQNSGNAITCAFATTANTATGNYLFKLQVNDSATTPSITTSSSDGVVLNKAITAPSAPTIFASKLDADQPESVTALIPSTGTSPYSYSWLVSVNSGNYVSATQCTANTGSNQNSGNTVTCSISGNTLSSGSTYNFELQVSDSASTQETASSPGSQTITVASKLSAPSVPLPSAPILDVNQAESVTGTMPSTGTPPYSYTWLVSANGGTYSTATQCTANTGSNQNSGNTVTCSISGNTLSSGSTYNFELQVSDSATISESVISPASNSISVSSQLTAPSAPTIFASKLDADQPESVTALIPSTGTSPYSYSWLVSVNSGNYVSATQCTANTGSNQNSGNTVTCSISGNTLSSGSTYNFELQVSDSASTQETASSPGSQTITVASKLSAPSVPLPSAPILDVNQAESVTGTMPSTGTPPYSYTWLVSANGGTYSTATQCTANTGSNQNSGNTVTCSISGNTLTAGDSYNLKLQIVDSASTSETLSSLNSNTIKVNSKLTPPSAPTIDNTTIDQGALSTIIGTMPSTGSPPFSYNWLVEAPNTDSFTAANSVLCQTPSGYNQNSGNTIFCQFLTNSLTTTGNYIFELNVTDGASFPESAISQPSNHVRVYSFTASMDVINETSSINATKNSTVNITVAQGSKVSLNVSIGANSGIGPFTVDIYQLDPTVIASATIPVGGGSHNFDLTFNTGGSITLVTAITDSGTSPPYTFNMSTTKVKVIPPLAPSSGGGGGGGGGSTTSSTTSQGSSGPSGPTVAASGPLCYTVSDFATFNHVTIYFPGLSRSFFIYQSVISTNYSTEIINGNTTINTYLNANVTIGRINDSNFILRLTNITYVPALHTISLEVCEPAITVPVAANTTIALTAQNGTITAISSNHNNTVELIHGNTILSTGIGIAEYNITRLLPGNYTIIGKDEVSGSYSTIYVSRAKLVPKLEFIKECSNYPYNGTACVTKAEILTGGNQLNATLSVNNGSVGSTFYQISSTQQTVGNYTYVFSTAGNANYTANSISYSYKILPQNVGVSVLGLIFSDSSRLLDAIEDYLILIILAVALTPPSLVILHTRRKADVVGRFLWGLSNGWSLSGVGKVRYAISRNNAEGVVAISDSALEDSKINAALKFARKKKVRIFLVDPESTQGSILKLHDDIGVVLWAKSKKENSHPLLKKEERIILKHIKALLDRL